MKIFCHRGKFGCTDMGLEYLSQADAKGEKLKNLPPENTEESIRAAFEAGFGVEVDVVMTKDSRIIVTHTNRLSNHSKDAAPTDFASEMNLADVLKMKTGMGGKTADFLLYSRLLVMMEDYPNLFVNVEIKGTIDGIESKPELLSPSLVEKLILITPERLFKRIIWSSFSLSQLCAIKKAAQEANVAQLFCPEAHDGKKIYPNRDDVYMSFNVENLKNVLVKLPRLNGVHPQIGCIDDGAVRFCYDNNLDIRFWVLQERNPLKNDEAKINILNLLKIASNYPSLEIDIITDFADEVEEIING